MDLTHKDENTESTEERTIMMDSIKALHTGEVRNEDSSYDSGYESVPGGEESHSGDGEPAEDEVAEEEYQEYLAAKKERNKNNYLNVIDNIEKAKNAIKNIRMLVRLLL